MTSVAALSETLRAFLLAEEPDVAQPRGVLQAVAELPPGVLRDTSEHDYAQLLLLLDVSLLVAGDRSATHVLEAACDRYARFSILYTGRIIPRIRYLIEVLGRPVTSRSVADLVEVADQMSQGWPEYPESVFPLAFRRLAKTFDGQVDPADLTVTSYVAWRRGLHAAGEGDAAEAIALFSRSLERYQRYANFADAAWLFVDVAIGHLLAGDIDRALATAVDQRDYVQNVISTYGGHAVDGTPRDVFDVGDVRSGAYHTFVESLPVGRSRLSPRDQALLRRYVGVCERIISFAQSGEVREFDEAVDLFSFGWETYADSAYPVILGRLAAAVLPDPRVANPYRTVGARWRGMLASRRLPILPNPFITIVNDVRERLDRIHLTAEATVAVLDAAMLSVLQRDHDAVLALLTRHEDRMQQQAPALMRTVVAGVAAGGPDNLSAVLSQYLVQRAGFTLPSFIPALAVFSAGTPGRGPQLEVELLGDSLVINGIAIYEHCPPAVADVLATLQPLADDDADPPMLSTAELSTATGRTAAALAQVIRRFRSVCDVRMRWATGRGLDREAVIQGRPGYRFNPAQVAAVRVQRAPASARVTQEDPPDSDGDAADLVAPGRTEPGPERAGSGAVLL